METMPKRQKTLMEGEHLKSTARGNPARRTSVRKPNRPASNTSAARSRRQVSSRSSVNRPAGKAASESTAKTAPARRKKTWMISAALGLVAVLAAGGYVAKQKHLFGGKHGTVEGGGSSSSSVGAALAAGSRGQAASGNSRSGSPQKRSYVITRQSHVCSQPGERVGRTEALDAYFFVPERGIKNNNGSFELGIGTSDVFPGYHYAYWPNHQNLLDNLKHPPPLPATVTEEHHSGAKSLCLTLDNKDRSMLMYMRPPYVNL